MSREPKVVSSGAHFTAVDFGAPSTWSEFERTIGEQKFGKVFGGASLDLTGMEVSFGTIDAGVSFPIVHAHKQNEELYIAISGEGELQIDGVSTPFHAGMAVRIATAGMRALRAKATTLTYIVIQAKEKSLEQSTRADGIVSPDPVKW